MKYVTLGRTEARVSAVAYGAMSLRPDDAANGKAAAQRAYELGVNFFDTADVYSSGGAEEILGGALRDAKVPRDQVFVASKCGIVFPGMDASYEYKAYDLSKSYLKASCEASLKRLGFSYLDLYQPHRIDYLTHPEECAEAIEELKAEGKVRFAGVSNYTADEIRALGAYTTLSSLQTQFSLLHLEPLETGLHAVCLEKGMAILAWSPLDRGMLTGAREFERGDWREQRQLGVVTQVKEFADRYGVTPSQLALRWLLELPGPVIPLVGSANPAHIEEAVGALDFTIERDDWYELMVTARGRPMPWGQPPYAYLKER